MMEFLNKLKTLGKSWYTIADLKKVTGLSRNSLYVQLSRYVQNKVIIRLTWGVYILPEQYANIDNIANALYMPSYLSFESALSRQGIASQIPYTLTFATTRKSLTRSLGQTRVEYRSLQPHLFFGYEKIGSLFVARPEKALLDILYFITFGKSPNTLRNLDLKEINRVELKKLTRKYPKKTQRLAEQFVAGA